MGNGLGVFGIEVVKLLKDKFNAFPDQLELFRSKILNSRKYKDWLVLKNQENLLAGKRADNTDIEKIPVRGQTSTRYERLTRYRKEKYGEVYEHVTLYDTGNLHESLKIKSGSETLYFEFLDPKYPEIERIWGNVKGINDYQKNQFINMLYLDFLKFTNDYFSKQDLDEIIQY
jgi:hypothetical protein